MSERAIQKLKQKFIWTAMGTLLVTMLLISGLLYLGNTAITRRSIRNTLEYIAENNGELIEWENKNEKMNVLDKLFALRSDYKSSEFQFSTRYFAILYDKNMNTTDIKTSYISDVTKEEAMEYGQRALNNFFKFGHVDQYYYRVVYHDDGSCIVVYLERSNFMYANDRLFYLALTLIAFGMIVAFFVVRIIANHAIKNEIRNAELQKQFMTNASHELKTPLAVIRANTEMEEIMSGENEWTESTLRQIERMSGLIQNLVMITRADENQSQEGTKRVDITKVIHETVQNFQSLAVSNGKALEESVNPKVQMYAQEAQIRQLCSLLVDNAIKYCDDEGVIRVGLSQRGKGITLTVSNNYAKGDTVDYTKFFERFYREDQSHNTDKGGYGIGLSIAESLVRQYRGTIDVNWKNGVISFVCQLKPMR